jgi:hypothetical protein
LTLIQREIQRSESGRSTGKTRSLSHLQLVNVFERQDPGSPARAVIVTSQLLPSRPRHPIGDILENWNEIHHEGARSTGYAEAFAHKLRVPDERVVIAFRFNSIGGSEDDTGKVSKRWTRSVKFGSRWSHRSAY